MKVRVDFVTNSSSSCFCAFGMSVEKLLKIADEDKLEEIKNEGELGSLTLDPDDKFFYENFVGYAIGLLLEDNPEAKVKDLKSIVAQEFNDQFKISVTEDDITYYEEAGWC